MSEEIEWFKRFADCYIQWSHSNFDRIARDVVNKHKAVIADTSPLLVRKLSSYSNELFKEYREKYGEDYRFASGINWGNGSEGFKVGTVLKIKLPTAILKDREPSFWEKLLTGTNRLFRSLTHRA